MSVHNIKPNTATSLLMPDKLSVVVAAKQKDNLQSGNTGNIQLKKSVDFFMPADVKSDFRASENKPMKSLMEIAREVGEKLRSAGVKVQFRINRELKKVIIVVKDPVTNEVIREIPPEEYLKTVESLKNMQQESRVKGLEIDLKY